MPERDPTLFDELWTRGFATIVPPDHPVHETIRQAGTATWTGDERTGDALRVSQARLPHITIGEDTGPLPDADAPDFTVTGLLGEGGMGVVHLAHQASLEREVAVKRVRDGAQDRAGEALLREGRFMGGLEHPNIIPVHALGADDDGRPALVMKRVEGVAWRSLVRDGTHPGWDFVQSSDDRVAAHVQILVDVCNGVHFAHTRGVLHRDLKPENVMLGEHGEVYVLDWGIAVHADARGGADTRNVVGTPSYMAPEMLVAGERVDARTDVYLLGACLHEALTGRPRHAGTDLQKVIAAAFVSAPAEYAESVPEELGAIANKATAADPDERYPDVDALRQALQDFLAHRASIRVAERAEQRAAEDDFAGAHFGFRAALDDWDGNERARSGLRDLLERRVAAEIGQKNVGLARQLLAELEALGSPRQEELAAQLRGIAADHDQLRELAAELDTDVSFWQRYALVTAISVTGMLMSGGVFVAVNTVGWTANFRDMIALAAGINVVVWLGVAAGWRSFTRNAINRQIIGLVLLGCGTALMNRVFGWLMEADPIHVLALDLVIVSLTLAAGAVTVAGLWLWLVALGWFAGAVLIAVVPERAAEVFLFVPVFGSLPGSALWAWQNRPGATSPPATPR